MLAAVVLSAYGAYVRMVERRAVTELVRPHLIRELSGGVLLGTVLLSLTMGALAALGAYRLTGINGWWFMVATVPALILAAVLEEVLMPWNCVSDTGTVAGKLERPCALGSSVRTPAPAQSRSNAGQCDLSDARGGNSSGCYLHVHAESWFCIGVHFARDFAQGGIFSASVSGRRLKDCCRGASRPRMAYRREVRP